MDAIEAILTRRSIRKYTGDPVPEELLRSVIEASMYAPSAGNEQPWHFVVIDDRALLDRIPSFHPHSLMLREANVAVLVCGDLDLEKHAGYWVQDCAAATLNLLLAAHAKGLAGVWVGVHPREDRVEGFRKLLNIPERVIPFSLIPLGYPAEQKQMPQRFNRERMHRNGW